MVRPRVARGIRRAGVVGLASMYPVFDWSCFAPDHYGYQRACDLIVGQTSMGQLGHQCSHAPGRPILNLFSSSRRPRRVKGLGLRRRLAFQCSRRLDGLSNGRGEFARFEGASMGKNAPGDPGQFIGQRNREYIVVQPLPCGFNPGLEAVTLPALRFDQHHPCRLHEQNPQVAVTSLRYLAEDGAVPGRYLLGDKAQPGGEVAAFGEHIACADCRYHRAGDDRPDTGYADQPLATRVPARDGFDLLRQTLDALVEPAPVSCQIFDDAHHAWRQSVGGCGENARQLVAKEAQSLPNGDATFQQEGADLVDDAGALAHQPLPYAVQPLQVELVGGLGRDELHRRALHRLRNGLRVAEVVLLSLRIGPNVPRRHQPRIVAKFLEPAAEMMSTDAGFHADPTWRHIREPSFHLAARPLL